MKLCKDENISEPIEEVKESQQWNVGASSNEEVSFEGHSMDGIAFIWLIFNFLSTKVCIYITIREEYDIWVLQTHYISLENQKK